MHRRLSTDSHGRAAPVSVFRLDATPLSRACIAVRHVRPAPVASPGWCGRGRAGALMAGPEVRESVTLAGRAERARVARAFVGGVLGPGHPCGDDAALLVSELFGNSVRHSRSGAAGGTVTVAVSAGDGLVRVEVTDRGRP